MPLGLDHLRFIGVTSGSFIINSRLVFTALFLESRLGKTGSILEAKFLEIRDLLGSNRNCFLASLVEVVNALTSPPFPGYKGQTVIIVVLFLILFMSESEASHLFI